jgi:hypothetical protein
MRYCLAWEFSQNGDVGIEDRRELPYYVLFGRDRKKANGLLDVASSTIRLWLLFRSTCI